MIKSIMRYEVRFKTRSGSWFTYAELFKSWQRARSWIKKTIKNKDGNYAENIKMFKIAKIEESFEELEVIKNPNFKK